MKILTTCVQELAMKILTTCVQELVPPLALPLDIGKPSRRVVHVDAADLVAANVLVVKQQDKQHHVAGIHSESELEIRRVHSTRFGPPRIIFHSRDDGDDTTNRHLQDLHGRDQRGKWRGDSV